METKVKGVVDEGGDNNTRFFHRMTNAHSRRNWLSKLRVNGCWHSNENDLKNCGGGVSKAVLRRRWVTFLYRRDVLYGVS